VASRLPDRAVTAGIVHGHWASTCSLRTSASAMPRPCSAGSIIAINHLVLDQGAYHLPYQARLGWGARGSANIVERAAPSVGGSCWRPSPTAASRSWPSPRGSTSPT
jgi:hypothetical protein